MAALCIGALRHFICYLAMSQQHCASAFVLQSTEPFRTADDSLTHLIRTFLIRLHLVGVARRSCRTEAIFWL